MVVKPPYRIVQGGPRRSDSAPLHPCIHRNQSFTPDLESLEMSQRHAHPSTKALEFEDAETH